MPETEKKWIESFIKAQSEFPEIPTDSTATVEGISKGGKPYKYSYPFASLPAILRAVLPVLHKHGFALVQTFVDNRLVTEIIHEGGESRRSEVECSSTGLTPQDWGKKVTYYRRYSVVPILGIAPDRDFDAADVGASSPDPSPTKTNFSIAEAIDEVMATLRKNDTGLVKEWLPSGVTKEDAKTNVTKLIDQLSRGDEFAFIDTVTAEEVDALYLATRQHINRTIDERNAERP